MYPEGGSSDKPKVKFNELVLIDLRKDVHQPEFVSDVIWSMKRENPELYKYAMEHQSDYEYPRLYMLGVAMGERAVELHCRNKIRPLPVIKKADIEKYEANKKENSVTELAEAFRSADDNFIEFVDEVARSKSDDIRSNDIILQGVVDGGYPLWEKLHE